MLAEMVTKIRNEFNIVNFHTKDITGEGQDFFKLAKIIDDRKSIKPSFFPQTQFKKQTTFFLRRPTTSQQKQIFL